MGLASDIPEAGGFSDTRQMARKLASYLDCPRAVKRAVEGEFGHSPAIVTIERYRREHLATRALPPEPAFKPHEGYYPQDASRLLEYNNRVFLNALRREHPARCGA